MHDDSDDADPPGLVRLVCPPIDKDDEDLVLSSSASSSSDGILTSDDEDFEDFDEEEDEEYDEDEDEDEDEDAECTPSDRSDTDDTAAVHPGVSPSMLELSFPFIDTRAIRSFIGKPMWTGPVRRLRVRYLWDARPAMHTNFYPLHVLISDCERVDVVLEDWRHAVFLLHRTLPVMSDRLSCPSNIHVRVASRCGDPFWLLRPVPSFRGVDASACVSRLTFSVRFGSVAIPAPWTGRFASMWTRPSSGIACGAIATPK